MSKKNDLLKNIIQTTDARGKLMQVNYEQIKTVFIAEGLSSKDIAVRFNVSESLVESFIKENKLEDLRKAYVRQGISKIQNVQINQAQKLMDLESSFKKMRIIQLEKMLEDYAAYFAKHGHFYKLHPITDEIMKDNNGMPMYIKLPNVSREILQLKESVTLSEGLKQVLTRIDDIINKPSNQQYVDTENPDVIDITDYGDLFKKRKDD